MNSFLTRYSSTSPEADIRKAKELFGDDDDVSNEMWGSAGGFGNLASGVPMFKLPSVQDVRIYAYRISCEDLWDIHVAHRILEDAYRRPCRSVVPYQN